MTINDVHRAPELSERIALSLFTLFVPSVIFYMNAIRPLKKVEAHLRKALKLEDKH